MTVGSISASGLGQYVLSASNSTQVQQALQSLQNSLTSGDLNSAQSAFQTLQKLYQDSATASGSTPSSQFTTDLAAVGNALTSGDLATAQSAFATFQGDLKGSASPAQIAEATAAAQSLQLVEGLLSTLNSAPSTTTSSDASSTNSILQSVYGNASGLSVFA